jgi:hypothetical protein
MLQQLLPARKTSRFFKTLTFPSKFALGDLLSQPGKYKREFKKIYEVKEARKPGV